MAAGRRGRCQQQGKVNKNQLGEMAKIVNHILQKSFVNIIYSNNVNLYK